jgi:prepilin signal peptidase PulO-like enzyme (type II secretory pathway)
MLASFAGVISERLNTGESWVRGRSHCNSCNRTLSSLDLIPVVSWLFTFGRCRACKAPVPYRYPLAEATLAVLFIASYLRLGLTLPLLFLLASLVLLTMIVLYDLRHTIVPLQLALPFIATSLAYAISATPSMHALSLVFLVSGAIAVGFFLMHVLSKGQWMGLGDTPVALALSFIAGSSAVAGLLFSFWIGAVIGIGILVASPKGHRMGIEVPFVPFLAAGYLLAFFTQWNPFLF